MPEIGETLRETRMRAAIDMTEVEAATKIRAKYLRALENEEWDLLPGPTFVKTFLRTYAEYLGLDPRLLVEEYRQRYERPTDAGADAVRARAGGRRAAAAGARGRSAPWHRARCGHRRAARRALRPRHAGATRARSPATASARRRHRHADRHADADAARSASARPRRRACALQIDADRHRSTCASSTPTGAAHRRRDAQAGPAHADLPRQALPR